MEIRCQKNHKFDTLSIQCVRIHDHSGDHESWDWGKTWTWPREYEEDVLQELRGSDWECAFEYAGEECDDRYPYGSPKVTSVIGSETDTTPFGRHDVDRVIALDEGERDDQTWIVIGKLKDGRWFYLTAWCDYTGWDCQAGGSAEVADTLSDIIRYALTDEDRRRLGIDLDILTKIFPILEEENAKV